MLITTSSVVGVQLPLLIVHLKVTVLPAVNPVTVVVALLGSVITNPAVGPPTSIHAPVPDIALLPLKVKLLLLHWKISEPAAATVGL